MIISRDKKVDRPVGEELNILNKVNASTDKAKETESSDLNLSEKECGGREQHRVWPYRRAP